MTPRERATYLVYAAGWSVVRRLPERAAYRLFDVVADLAWRRRGPRVRQLERNLARARPAATAAQLRALSRAGMRSYLRYWCDAFRLPDWPPERVAGRVVVTHEERLRDPVATRTGVVMALMHMGNWDHAGAWAAVTGTPVVTVAERLRPERLYERFAAYRERLGIEIVPLTGGDRDPADVLVQRLREGRAVPLLADRDLRAGGVAVDLLGERATLPPGPALLALRTGAPLVPVAISYLPGKRPGGHRIRIDMLDPVKPPPSGSTREKVVAMTQATADAFGRAIAARPEDWHMLQPLWSADVRERAAR